MDDDFLLLESAITAIEEAASSVAREVERGKLDGSALGRLSTVEAELERSRQTLERIVRGESGRD